MNYDNQIQQNWNYEQFVKNDLDFELFFRVLSTPTSIQGVNFERI